MYDRMFPVLIALIMAVSLSVLFLPRTSEHFTGDTHCIQTLKKAAGEQKPIFPLSAQGAGSTDLRTRCTARAELEARPCKSHTVTLLNSMLLPRCLEAPKEEQLFVLTLEDLRI